MKIRDWFLALDIFAKYQENGYDEAYIIGADHDIIFFWTNAGDIDEDSTDGKMLLSLGFHIHNSGSWARHV